MKSTRELLKETFASLPQDFAYREVKFYVYHALQKLEVLEKRQVLKQKQEHEQWVRDEEKKKSQPWMPPIYREAYHAKKTLDIIDSMIDGEKKIIESIQNKKIQKPKGETRNDEDDGLQTLHG